MSFGKRAKNSIASPAKESSKPAAKPGARAHWMRGVAMSLAVAVVNVIFFAWTGDSLPSPRYGAWTRHGNQPNPGGAIALTATMLLFALFCYGMHRRQVRKEQKANDESFSHH